MDLFVSITSAAKSQRENQQRRRPQRLVVLDRAPGVVNFERVGFRAPAFSTDNEFRRVSCVCCHEVRSPAFLGEGRVSRGPR
jgi:hypothetical protein